MGGGVRGGRGARESVGIRESGHEARLRAGLGSLPGELGAERRLPEFAEAEAAKRRFDAGHREAVEYEFHRAFNVFHERKGPGLFSGSKGSLYLPGYRGLSPTEFVNAKPRDGDGWTLGGVWRSVTEPKLWVIFFPWLALTVPRRSDALLGIATYDKSIWEAIPSQVFGLGHSRTSDLTLTGAEYRDKSITRTDKGFSSNPSWIGTTRIAPAFTFVSKETREGPSETEATGLNLEAPASPKTNISDFARHMDSVQVTRARMDELAQNGFSSAEQLEFLEKLKQASTAKTGGEFAAPTFFTRTRKISPPHEASWLGAEPRIPLPAYNADIFWDGNSSSWSFRPRLNKVDWIIKRSGEFLDVRHAEITLSLNESLHNKLQVKFLPEVRVYVDISIQMDPVEGRRVLVVTEQFDKEKPMYGEALPTWGRSTIP